MPQSPIGINFETNKYSFISLFIIYLHYIHEIIVDLCSIGTITTTLLSSILHSISPG